jgi:tetratricopeptide (TPR) repeat protein
VNAGRGMMRAGTARQAYTGVATMNRNRIVGLVAGVLVLAGAYSVLGADGAEEAKQLVQQAQELVKAQKFDEAVAVMKKAIQLDPANDLVLATASDCELKAGKFADGMEHALQAVRLNDKVGAYHVLVAANAIGEQDLDRARESCELVLKRGPKEIGAGPCNDARTLLDLVVSKTFTLYWKLDPQKGRLIDGKLAIALPKTDLPYQTTTYEISDVQSQRLVKGEVNDILYVVPQGTKPFALTTKVTVQPYSYKKELARAAPKPLPEDARAWLGPCLSINPKSPVLTKVVADLKSDNPVETVRGILAWDKKNIEYKLDKPKTLDDLDFKVVDEIVERGHAECRGHAMLFVALCRAAGIPARPIWGLTRVAPGQDKQFGDIASHNWAEFYVTGVGWVPVDPQRPETLGFLPTNDIRIFMDAKKSKTSTETLPMFNLAAMNGDKLKFDEAR